MLAEYVNIRRKVSIYRCDDTVLLQLVEILLGKIVLCILCNYYIIKVTFKK